MKHVIIDGVRYVPIAEAHVSAQELMIALAETYMGPGLDPDEDAQCFTDLRIWVTEDYQEGVPTIVEFVADLLGRLSS